MSASNKERIEKVIGILQSIVKDTGVPRNIRKTVSDVIQVLLSTDKSDGVKAGIAAHMLDEISMDMNMPSTTRIKIWECLGELEKVHD
ncbi:MAG: hypothetical protein DRN96_02920 [Thermoproteota archaeon]|nr:MAG: hypothetical protein DRN96_02920 [Candidatus Korarchaeota archaeon]RLG55926.1 MAG: hypothetical protein DRN99_01150 [Candidatus Korarchaeota archaeon]